MIHPEVRQKVEDWKQQILAVYPHVDRSDLGRYIQECLRMNADTLPDAEIRRPHCALLDTHDAKLRALGKRLRQPNQTLGEIQQSLSPSLKGLVRQALNRFGRDAFYRAKAAEHDEILAGAMPVIRQVHALEAS